jgi:hypothetical protein
MGVGGGDEGACDVAQQRIGGGAAREIPFDALVHRRIGTALGDPVTVGLGGDLCANRRQMIRARGIVDVGQACGPCVCQRPTAPAQGAGGPQGGRRDRGLREQAAAPKRRHLVGIDLVLFRLAAMDRLHGEGMTEDARDACVSAPVGQPVPGEQARDGDDNPLSIRGHDVQEGLRAGLHLAVHQDRAVLVEDADVHRPGVPVDAAVKWVRSGVQSPEVSSCLVHRFFL